MTRIRSVAGVITLLSTVAMAAPLAVSAAPAAPPRSSAGPTPVDGAPAQGTIVHQQPTSTVFEPPPGVIAGNAFADAVDSVDSQGKHTRTVLMSWQANEDVPAADSLRTLIRSDDGGRTFPSGHTEGISGFYRKLRTGDLLGVEFIPTRVIDGHHAELLQKRSSDGGRTWRTESSIFTTDKTINEAKMNRGLRIHRDLLEDSEGNLLMGYYTNNTEDSSGGSEIAISTDQGHSWQRRATVFQGADGRTFNESAIAWARNGDLVAVVRSHLGSDLSQLYTARSTDQGRSWSSPVPLNLATASGEPAPRTGVMPVLDLLPNGVMTLSFGRPDNWIAVSPDGLGHTFEQAQTTYVNYPEQNIGAWQRWHGSSGNGAHTVVASNKILQVGDNCAPSWGCPATDTGFQVDNKYRVWKKFIDVLSPGVGKIDLAGRQRAGTVQVETTMNGTNRRLPETGPLGAIDGSTDWASSAVRKDGAPGEYTLTLDRVHHLTRAGLSLHPGLPASATVEVSTDKVNWVKVVDTGTLVSQSLNYFGIDGVPARYVRVKVDDPNGRRAGGTMLNEIELYSSTDSFENDAVDAPPRGYTDTIGVTVTDVNTHGDSHAMRLVDAWSDRPAQATWQSSAADRQGLSFRYMSMGAARTLTFSVMGTTADGTAIPVYHLAQLSDGAIGWYDGKAWQKIAPAGSAPQKAWHDIAVSATLGGAEVSLNGKVLATVKPTTAGATALTGHKFGSSGTIPTYDNFVIDDVDQSLPN